MTEFAAHPQTSLDSLGAYPPIPVEQHAASSGADPVMAHIQAMKAQYGYYSWAEHGIGETTQQVSRAVESRTFMGGTLLDNMEDPAPAETPQQPVRPHAETFAVSHDEAKSTVHPLLEQVSGAATTPAAENANGSSPESLTLERYKKIFAPMPDRADADTLIRDDQGQLLDAEKRRKIEKTIPKVTEASRQLSSWRLERLRQGDPSADAIISRYADEHKVEDTEGLMASVRRDAGLRTELGTYFIDKIQAKLPDMPRRVQANTQKSPHLPIYDYAKELGLRSQEYVALLALAMVDGTFQTIDQDSMAYDEQGNVTAGVHRDAATTLLRTNDKALAA